MLWSADFFVKINLSKKNISEIPSQRQMVWIQIRPDISEFFDQLLSGQLKNVTLL